VSTSTVAAAGISTEGASIMLGDKVGAFTGKTGGRRVLPSGNGPCVEITGELTGELGGVAATWIGTYTSKFRPDGSLYGECDDQGLVMTADGVGTWTGSGVGWLSGGDGAASFRGAVYLTSAPPALAELGKVALVFEYEVAADGTATLALWAWN
jgi:hypothetical protein